MATTSLIVGDAGANAIQGGDGPDLIYGADPGAASASAIAATRVATGLREPLFATAPPGDARLFIVEKGGQIEVLDLATGQIRPFLDVSAEIATANEQGLLGFAFHPDFATNGLFYVNLTNKAGDSEIRSYRVSATDPGQAEPLSLQRILVVDQPDGLDNHKGGWLGFGPDGHLYAALGDGGGAGDPFNNAQNANSLLGKILRLDVSGDAFPADPARNYALPSDNPFVGHDGADEVWALGLRNPWRASFDRGTGDFYIADVGQGAWEEIDLGAAGANYGWRVFEGPAPFAAGTPTGGVATPPIASYGHDLGRSITGGYAYRGEAEALHGQYFYADFVTARVWTLRLESGQWVSTERTAQIAPDAGAINQPASFGEDARGNLYLVDFDGEVFRLTPQGSAADGADRLHGGGGNDVIFAGAGNDLVLGEAGADVLYGQSGDDALVGGPGSDRLIGGPGGDTFAVAIGSGNDVIADFSAGPGGGDVIEIARAVFADVAAVRAASRQVGADTVIALDAANTITLQGVSLASLSADDFVFV